MRETKPDSVSAALVAHLREAIVCAGGWIPFDVFMDLVLYAPGLGYYASKDRLFGAMPQSGSDFVTAPELSAHFGRSLAVQVAEGLDAAGSREVWEFGAGSGALAEQLLETLGDRLDRYTIIDVSSTLRARQQERLSRFGSKLHWADRWPDAMRGVVVGNEVLDAMPARLVAFDGVAWRERGVRIVGDGWGFEDRALLGDAPPGNEWGAGAVTERHDRALGFIRSLAAHLEVGLALFVDYGFPEAEYYHPQRAGGTLMCHRAHRSDGDPLTDVGDKDITAHVDFSGIALTAQDAGMDVLGYTSQGRFLLNCGLLDRLVDASLPERTAAQRLVNEHEMGELFKVLALGRQLTLDPVGFRVGDRMHRL
jgi:SAM-dependent MidA family methyltransferase